MSITEQCTLKSVSKSIARYSSCVFSDGKTLSEATLYK